MFKYSMIKHLLNANSDNKPMMCKHTSHMTRQTVWPDKLGSAAQLFFYNMQLIIHEAKQILSFNSQ